MEKAHLGSYKRLQQPPSNRRPVSILAHTFDTLMGKMALATLCLVLLIATIINAAPQQYCKPLPGSPNWPSHSDWNALNASVSGRLIAAVPPGLVCQTNSSIHSTAACSALLAQWPNSSFHADEPFTSDYNDDSCLPDPRAPCSTAPLPAYAVNATGAGDVQAAVRFAERTGVRLIVKGTGHDFLSRYLQMESFYIKTKY